MSGGSFEYKYLSLDIYKGQLEDKELNELLEDFSKLLHDLEWYQSSDTTQEDYQKTVKSFKKKWLKRRKREIIMSDCMEFPKSINEFIDSYKFKDTKEIYTNGAELIEVFRVEQALEYYDFEKRIEILEKALDTACKMIATIEYGVEEIKDLLNEKYDKKLVPIIKDIILRESEKDNANSKAKRNM